MLKPQILQAYVSGFCGVFGTVCGLAGLSGIASLFIGHFDLNKVLDSDHKLLEKRWSRKPAAMATSFVPEDGDKVAPGSSTSGMQQSEVSGETDVPEKTSPIQPSPLLGVRLDTWRQEPAGN